MKVTFNVSAATLRKLDAICDHWTRVREKDGLAVGPMTRDEWLELNVNHDHERDVRNPTGRRR